jgi:hypothetical protein
MGSKGLGIYEEALGIGNSNGAESVENDKIMTALCTAAIKGDLGELIK